MVSGLAVRKRVQWQQTYRIIRSIYPPVDLFEDIADPRDWEALAAVEEKTNPRIRLEIGDLGKIPAARRVSGPGASFVMAPFVHCSVLRPGRFTNGSYGIYYAGDSEVVAVAETICHHEKFMRATNEEPGWTADFRILIGSVDRDLDDVSAVPGVLHPDDYTASHVEGRDLRAAGSDGLVWDSVRMRGGRCIGAFWPDVITIPIQGRHYGYHWDGTRVDFVRQYDTGRVLAVT
ncbi:RES family NAD+ phosphorylase [Sinorhizobium medicae]|uniref:RES family NAD+ phosphorylase n=1 Tax=Sinorhizobium medicae TaxID=110321 RepID=UPI000C7B1A55|nr:RES family NAD+ phosphorylase [Sinorhizobium medicae]MDX0413437.1 RES domain-containing protein [Sinorhizobium medicae]MDX0450334.1 RES domain-containing protein [Sinorhizobium medicae]MDX0474478.1 RES domain-containing protein [Sinorhizobium medicae]MDX0659833.1 RES domain-containing protein [Sinorhizobium medicae]MDX0978677.1 RES domain-containing protein [Sinorhizobium medicae]